MQPRFNHGFDQVRIFSDDRAAQASRSIGARAFTVGSNIVFGSGEYRPDTSDGRHLLAHELAHTIQQRGRPEAIQRQPEPEETQAQNGTDAAPDPERALGERLWREFPAGVNVVFYDDSDREIASRATDVAARENAIASETQDFSAADLAFGIAFPDSSFKIGDTVPKLGAELKAAADKAADSTDAEPRDDTGPSQIRSLSVFAHGTPTWCGISNSLVTGNAPDLIKKIASHLTNDVNIVLYACSVARGASEQENWRKGTMESGGEDSLAAIIRDALVEEDKDQARVWGHTTVGHTTRNWALRVFKASMGEGEEGVSFAGDDVFGVVEQIMANVDVESAITALGHSIPGDKRERVEARIQSDVQQAFYDCYRRANRDETYQGHNLAEQAPNYPMEVAEVINDYWDSTFWPERKTEIAEAIINQLSLPKMPESGVPDTP